MTTHLQSKTDHSIRATVLLAVSYFALALTGLIGTWFYNLQFTGASYLGAWFANAASASAAVDLIVLVAVASVFYFREGLKLGWKWYLIVLLVPLSIGVALSFAFPLFLGLRELHLLRNRTVRH